MKFVDFHLNSCSKANCVVNCRFINSLVKSGDSSKNYWQKYNFRDGDYCEAQVGVFYLLFFRIQGFSSAFLLFFSPANSLLLLFLLYLFKLNFFGKWFNLLFPVAFSDLGVWETSWTPLAEYKWWRVKTHCIFFD